MNSSTTFFTRATPPAVLLFCVLGCGPTDPSRIDDEAQKERRPSKVRRNARLPSWDALGVQPREARDDDWFEDVTTQTGIRFSYRDGREKEFYTLLEVMGGGVATFDYDRDGDMDLFFTGGGYFKGPPIEVFGYPPALYRNEGNWKFTDVTQEAGLVDDRFYTYGCTVGDYDRDGWPDLFVAGYGGCKLYRNERGQRFIDATAMSRLDCDVWNLTGAWLDYDRDGWLDLYVLTYADWDPRDPYCLHPCFNEKQLRDICPPKLYAGHRDYLYRNQGDGTFLDVTDAVGLVNENRGMGIVSADFNEDGWMDIYVANDVEENQLYMGSEDLSVSEQAIASGVAYSALGEPEGSMGVDVGDFNNDGTADLFYTNFIQEDNTLIRQLPGGGFQNINDVSGVTATSRMWAGFGTGFADFDNDGDSDLLVVNGHVGYERVDGPYYQPAQLYANIDGERIEEVSDRGGPYFSVPHSGRGASVCDLDNDGSLDLVVVHQNRPVAVIRNRHTNENWIRVSLRGTVSNNDAIGARVELNEDGRKQKRWQRGGGGYLSYFDPRHHFALQNSMPVDITVHWPTGKSETFADLAPSMTHELVEGEGRAEMRDGNQ